MRRLRTLLSLLVSLVLAGLAASAALALGGPVVRVGGFSSQVTGEAASVAARIAVRDPGATGAEQAPGAAAFAGAAPAPAPPPPPTLPSDSPLLDDPSPVGPGSLWYEGTAGERCIYAPAASPLCYLIVLPAAPVLDVPALAAGLAGRLSLSLAPIDASPAAARRGLSGAATWFWLAAAPATKTLSLSLDGETVTVSAEPGAVSWRFGDGASLEGGAGIPYQAGKAAPAAVTHVYATRCLPGDRGTDPYVLPGCAPGGYPVSATVTWTIGYSASGPIEADAALPERSSASELAYPVSEVRSFLNLGPG